METKDQQLHAMRHSTAHILASAVTRLWPDVKLGIGPVVENGFYYDIDIPGVTISEVDFKKIESEMKKIVGESQDFMRSEQSIDTALEWAQTTGQTYKEELLNDLKRQGTTLASEIDPEMLGVATSGDSNTSVSFYTNGEFTDLCRGPHVQNTKEVGAFKLLRIAGAYWRGKDTNPQMQRLYGVAFPTKQELDEYLTMLDEAKKRDHRKLGQELDLFVFSELVGPGLPLWTPRGTIIRHQLDSFVQEMRDEVGFQAVSIPHITKKDLYIRSGHWAKFSDELFKITTREGHEFAMKPMNCPHHTQIYASRQRSYRDLPLRYRETTMVYRDEQSGELGGLSRVRGITQDDAHIFCRYSQARDEVLAVWDIIERFYSAVGISLSLRLSLHDPSSKEAYLGTTEQWLEVEQTLRDIALEKVGDNFEEAIGDAAFYGPKLDFLGKDAIGRTHQVATIQFDFNQPEGFDLSCISESGEEERIAMIHCAIMGSHERFLSVYIEHTAGRFPVWVAPEQIRILTVNQEEETVSFAKGIVVDAEKLGLRVHLDNESNSVGKKIRDSEIWKVPYTLVIGEKEVASGKVTPRIRSDMQVQPPSEMEVGHFLQSVANEAKSRTSHASM